MHLHILIKHWRLGYVIVEIFNKHITCLNNDLYYSVPKPVLSISK